MNQLIRVKKIINNSAARGGVVTNVPVGNTSSSVVDLTMTSSVFQSENKLGSQDWLRTGGIQLTRENKSEILRGDKLNDLIINFVQKLLKKQFPLMKGLQSTLMQYKSPKHLTMVLLPRYRLSIVVVTIGSLDQ